MVSGWWDVGFVGRYWGTGGSLGAVIMGCVVYGIQLCWVVVVGYYVRRLLGSLRVHVLSGGFLASGVHCVCVCVRACVHVRVCVCV